MPFTLSHPAAVIPIRRYGIFSALVVGSMMPDSLYFVPFIGRHEYYGHSVEGLFTFCLPAGVALLWLFHRFLKKPLISLFPMNQQRKLLAVSPDFHFGPLKRLAWIAASVLVGAASHITWDSFTHANQWGAAYFPVLRQSVLVPPHFTFLIAELLQLASSVVGMSVLFFYYWRWSKTASPSKVPVNVHLPAIVRIFFVVAFGTGALAPAIARVLSNPTFWLHFRRGLIGYGAVDGIKVLCLEILIFCTVWHLSFGQRQNAKSPTNHSSEA